MASYTYQESVQWIREQPELEKTVKECYLDSDTIEAAQRFAASEEFAEIVILLKLNQTKQRMKILDIGCGNGIVSYAFANLGHDVTAIDPDESDDVGLKAIEKLMAPLKIGSITPVKACAEHLPNPSSSFDIVYTRQALHHFSDLRLGMQESARVLKPGGFLLATREHVVDNDEQLQIFLRDHLLHKMHGGEHAYPLQEYLSAINNANLKIVRCLSPYDSVINHFPVTNDQMLERLRQCFVRRVGAPLANILMNCPPATNYVRYHLASTCATPGRMYSFLCRKPL